MTENNPAVKQNVKAFYDRIGWKIEDNGYYQNAIYEDLRPVSQEYLHKCHLRVNRHLSKEGKFFLDAGSGPIQWPEYMTYSEGYRYRVCADLSITGLKEAQKRKPGHVLCVVADIANLPFKDDAFDGSVSMHTIHHVPADEKKQSYLEMHRTLKPGQQSVVVNGWSHSPIMKKIKPLMQIVNAVKWRIRLWTGKEMPVQKPREILIEKTHEETPTPQPVTGTYIKKLTPEILKAELAGEVQYTVYPWRSVNIKFLRAFIYPWAFGKLILRWIYWLEERHSEYFGNNGQYSMVVIKK